MVTCVIHENDSLTFSRYNRCSCYGIHPIARSWSDKEETNGLAGVPSTVSHELIGGDGWFPGRLCVCVAVASRPPGSPPFHVWRFGPSNNPGGWGEGWGVPGGRTGELETPREDVSPGVSVGPAGGSGEALPSRGNRGVATKTGNYGVRL